MTAMAMLPDMNAYMGIRPSFLKMMGQDLATDSPFPIGF
jgi:hypothetical protein